MRCSPRRSPRGGVARAFGIVDGDYRVVLALHRETLGEDARVTPEVQKRAVVPAEAAQARAPEHLARALVLGVDAREPGEEHAEHLPVQAVHEEARKRSLREAHQAGGLLDERLADVVPAERRFVFIETRRGLAASPFGFHLDLEILVAHQPEKRRALKLSCRDVLVLPRGATVLDGTRARARPRAERRQRGEVRVLAPGSELGRGHGAGVRRDRRRSARRGMRDATRRVVNTA